MLSAQLAAAHIAMDRRLLAMHCSHPDVDDIEVDIAEDRSLLIHVYLNDGRDFTVYGGELVEPVGFDRHQAKEDFSRMFATPDQ